MASRWRRISVSAVRRWQLFRPLAVLLAILMLPTLPSTRYSGFKAAAQAPVSACDVGSGNSIIRNYCNASGSIVPELATLESDSVKAYLALHGLPETDASVIYTYGRQDVRSAVRAIMIARLIAIVSKAPSERTASETALFNWYESIVARNEIEYYTEALSHFRSFQTDPCHFRPDSGVARAIGLDYDGGRFCTLLGTIYPPPVPSSDYFRMYGIAKSYGKYAKDYTYATFLTADTQLNLPMVAGVSAAVIAVTAGTAFAAVAGSIYAFLATPVVVAMTKVGDLYHLTWGVQSFSSSQFLIPALGVGAIVLVAALVTTTVAIEAFDNQRQLDNLANLETGLARARTTKPDLKAMFNDNSGIGLNKISMSLIGQTLPEVESPAALPQRNPNVDPMFKIADTRGISMTFNEMDYMDWNETVWKATAWGGWFVQKCDHDPGVSTCAVRDSITGTIRYLDWKGNKWTASRLGNRFTHTKASAAAAGDAPCPADPITGVSTATDVSKCTSYVSNSISLKDGTRHQVTVTLVPNVPPRFTGSTVLSFSSGLPVSYPIVFEGTPAPTICATAVTTPAAIKFPACGTSFTITYDGSPLSVIGTFPVRLTATNSVRTVIQDFAINIGTDVKFVTPASLTAVYKQPVNFTIVAAGSPRPRFTVDPGLDLRGLTFKDNLDGTATISGTSTLPTVLDACVEVGGATCPKIRASNGRTSDSQIFTVFVDGAPRAEAVEPFAFTAPAGVSTEFSLVSRGATTPVTWQGDSSNPSWIRLDSGADGVGRLTVTPPVGTSGSFSARFSPGAEGSQYRTSQVYTINVVNTPVFTSSSVLEFTVGNPGAVVPKVQNVTATSGVVSLNSLLPAGITGQSDPANSRYSLTAAVGYPLPGSGGQYPLQFTSTSPSGTGTGDVTVRIFEGPTISGDPLAVMFAGRPGRFLLSATGYPSTGSTPGLLTAAPTSPSDGLGMYFATQGLPPSLQASNLNEAGFPTGILRVSGTPASTQTGTYRLQVTAANGVGSPVQRNMTLIVFPYAPTTSVQLLTASTLTRDKAGNIVATLAVGNSGRDAAQNVTLTSVRLNGVNGIIAPASVASIAAASAAMFTVQFPANAAPTGVSVLSVAGSHSGGTFSSGARVVVP